MSDPEDYLFLSLTSTESLVMILGLILLTKDSTAHPTVKQNASELAAKIRDCIKVQKIPQREET